jgi:periplasmic protein TonB
MHTGAGLAGASIGRIEDGRLRLLALAVLASLVLHLLIFYALPILKDAVKAPVPLLKARLVKPAPPVPPELPKPEPLAQRPVAPHPVPSAKAAPQRPVPAAVSVAPTLSIESPKLPAEPAFTVPAAPPAPAPAAPGLQAPAASAGPAPASAASGPDPGSIERYRLDLMETARRYKRYPRIAQDNNWEGRVELRIAFAGSGAIASMTVKKGAGHVVLDEEAQEMIRRAQAQVAIPPALRGKVFALEIAVDFFLKDDAR